MECSIELSHASKFGHAVRMAGMPINWAAASFRMDLKPRRVMRSILFMGMDSNRGRMGNQRADRLRSISSSISMSEGWVTLKTAPSRKTL